MAAILWALAAPLYFDEVIIWPPAGRPVSADLIDDALDSVDVDALCTGPSVLEELSQSQASLDRLRKVEYVGFGGGKRICLSYETKIDSIVRTDG